MTDDISKAVREMLSTDRVPDDYRGSASAYRAGWNDRHSCESATTPAEVGEVDAAASNLNLAAVHAKPEHKPLIVDAIGLIRTLARQLAEAKAMIKWMPIETAPKDETPILAHNPEWIGAPMILEWDTQFGAWFSHDGGCGETPQPTHWMPLPPKPEAA